MPIIYAVVASTPEGLSSHVLCEYATSSGNFANIARKILDKLDWSGEPRRSYTYDEHVFHLLRDDTELVFMCMCDHAFGRVLPFQFLNEIRTRWHGHVNSYGLPQLAASSPDSVRRGFSMPTWAPLLDVLLPSHLAPGFLPDVRERPAGPD